MVAILGRFGLPLEQGLRPAVGNLGVVVVGPRLLHGRLGGRDVSLLGGGLEPLVLGLGGCEVGLGDQQLGLQVAVVEPEQRVSLLAPCRRA